jgi:hypothetical protein
MKYVPTFQQGQYMGLIIKEMLDFDTIHILTSIPTATAIYKENVKQAAKKLVGTIKSLELYPDYQTLIDRFETLQKSYPSIYDHRPFYIWQVGQTAYQLATLNSPSIDFLQANFLKCQLGVITILLDDICDMGHDKALFRKCVLALEGKVNQDEMELYQVFTDIWTTFQNSIQKTPNYLLLKTTLEEAYQKWLDSFEYSLWLEETSRSDEKWERHLEIISHSGTIYLAGLIDLLYVPNLTDQQISAACSVFIRTQKMVQIPNWLASWEREFTQRDFTSGVFSIALENHWVEWDDLMNMSLNTLKQKIHDSSVEAYLWGEWERLRDESHEIVNNIQLTIFDEYVDYFSMIMCIQVMSSGII